MRLEPFDFHYARTRAGIALSTPLNLPERGLVWLTGASGSGKSTLLNLIKGLYPEFIHGTLAGGNPAIARDALYLSQNPHTQIVHERVGEEFFFSMEHRQYTPEQMHAKKYLLEQYGLGDMELKPTAQLSHGQAQRLLLASMLATEPKVLLLDEPTAFLDEEIRTEFYQLLNELKQHVCILLVDHHMQVAEYADVCWHISEQGELNKRSPESWLHETQQALQQLRAESSLTQTPPPLSAQITLSLEQLVVGYDKKQPLFTANATLHSGECTVLCGENGSGKSTLLNTLAGMTKPLGGQCTLHYQASAEEALQQIKPREQMMYVFQHPDSHFFFDTVAEELTQLGVQDIAGTLAHFGLADCAERSPHQLSEGQKRRLTLLFPVLLQRALIVLDEPTFGQDALNAERITQLIRSFKAAGHALIVITHDATLHRAIADQTWEIRDGQLHIHAGAETEETPR